MASNAKNIDNLFQPERVTVILDEGSKARGLRSVVERITA